MTLLRRAVGPFEIVRMCVPGHRFPPHSHDRHLISANLCGFEQVRHDDDEFELDDSDLGLLNAGDVQASTSPDQRWTFVSLYIAPPRDGALPWRFGERSIRSSHIVRALAEVADSCFGRELDDRAFESRLDAIVQAVLDAAGRLDGAAPDSADRQIDYVRDALSAEGGPDVSVKSLAAAVGIGPSELVRRFKNVNGLPPIAWSYDRRLHRALHLIEDGASLAQVAAELGYCDQAHLSRRFKATIGASPAQWARSRISSKNAVS